MFSVTSQPGTSQRKSNDLFITPDRAPLLSRLQRGWGQRAGSAAAATWKPSKSPESCSLPGLPRCRDRASVCGGTNDTPGAGERPGSSNLAAGLWAPRSHIGVSRARAQVAAAAAPARRPHARGGASRVPFKRPHHPPLTSGCLSAPARVPRRSAPPRPQPRRRHDERRPGQRAARLGPPVRLCRRFLPAPAVSRLRASSRTMSVAGLKKQFHKATQVRRVTGAPRGGPGRSCEGRRGAGDPRLRRARRGRAPHRPPRPPRWKPALGPPPSARRRFAGAGGSRASHLAAPPPPPHLPARARLGGDPGLQVPGRRGGRLCKVAAFPVTLRCRCAGLSRDVLA